MTFKREISLDGVTGIIGIITIIVFLVTMNVKQQEQAVIISDHSDQLRKMNQTQSSLSQSIEVLTTIVNERTSSRVPMLATPRMKDNN